MKSVEPMHVLEPVDPTFLPIPCHSKVDHMDLQSHLQVRSEEPVCVPNIPLIHCHCYLQVVLVKLLESLEPKLVESLELEPVKSLEPEPVKSLELEPVKSVQLEPAKSLDLEPVKPVELEPVKAVGLEPVKSVELEPVKSVEPLGLWSQ